MAVTFQVLSDLHIDSYARRELPMGDIPVTECDAVLVAGDLANSDMGVRWLIQQADRLQKPIFMIMGNHDYFGQDILAYDTHICQLVQGSGVTFLQQDQVDFMGIRLLGCTLWTDYQYQASPNTIDQAQHFMQDYRQIFYGNRLFTPEDSIATHQRHRQWLQNALHQAKADSVPTLVMSHHSISPQSVSQKYAHLPTNAAFVTDFSDWLSSDFAPKLWLHGHTHEAFDYQQGNTRVVVNPRAYPNEISSTGRVFDWHKTVTLSPANP